MGQYAGHKLGRVVGLQVGRLESDKGITSRVRLIESIRGESLPVLPYFFECFFGVPAFGTAFQEFGQQGIQFRFELFPHGLAQLISLSFTEACQFLGEQHDLLLIDANTVGFVEVFLHCFQIIHHRLAPVLAVDKLGDVVQRAGPVQGVHGDEVFESGGCQFLHVLLHPGAFILKDGHRFAALEKLVGLGVIQRHLVHIELQAMVLLDEPHGILDNGQGLQPEEVHLQQAR